MLTKLVLTAVSITLAAAAGPPALAETPHATPGVAWTIPGGQRFFDEADHTGDRIRNMSGFACITPERCIAVSDERESAQFFSVSAGTVALGAIVDLVDPSQELDAEAVAVSGDTFFILGSHGLRRQKETLECASLHLFQVSSAPGPEARPGSLVAAILEHGILAKSFLLRQKDGGVDIEGAAVFDQQLYVGFRSPADRAHVYLLRMVIGEDLAENPTGSALIALPIADTVMGDTAGIRDIAAVEGGILLLTGDTDNAHAVDPLPAIYFWSTRDEPAQLLATIELPDSNVKAEGLLVRTETPDGYSVAIMFDGIDNGGITEYAVPAPRAVESGAGPVEARPEMEVTESEEADLRRRLDAMPAKCAGSAPLVRPSR